MNNYSKISIVLFVLIMSSISHSCTTNSSNNEIGLTIEMSKTNFHKRNFIEYTNQIEGEFNVLYFGSKKEIITINNFNPIRQNDIENYVTETQNFTHPNILYLLRRKLPKPNSEDLTITIDSSISYSIILNRSTTNSFNSRVKDTIIANPMIIENVSKNFLEITYENKVKIELQAMNRNGKWQNLTYPYQRFCGTGLYAHPFFPGEIVITSIPKFEGEFITIGRFKIHNYISDEFPISLNEQIFTNPFEEKNTDNNR